MGADEGGREGVIRITRDELLSAHVDDLLRRHDELRGEARGSTARRTHWYYRSWFLLMIAGVIGAAGAWAIIEPNFDDFDYVQGHISAIHAASPSPGEITTIADTLGAAQILGMIELNEDRVFVFGGTKMLGPDGRATPIHASDLQVGQEIGVQVEMEETPEGTVPVAAFVLAQPDPLPTGTAPRSLAEVHRRSSAFGMLLFPVVAGLIGLGVGAADGLVCRLLRRAATGGGIGLVVGLAGGLISRIVAELVYSPLNDAARQQYDAAGHLSTLGVILQVTGRGLAWAIAGMAMGLGQGIALRSKRLALYGFLGGMFGGLAGGLLFDPIELLIAPDPTSAHWSRMVGILVIGAGVGAFIGLVELLARDAWLRMARGPLAGKEFLLFKDRMRIGASPRSEIYLFNDAKVAPEHAVLRAVGDHCEIESVEASRPVLLNNRPIRSMRLRDGDEITIGDTMFVFHQRRA